MVTGCSTAARDSAATPVPEVTTSSRTSEPGAPQSTDGTSDADESPAPGAESPGSATGADDSDPDTSPVTTSEAMPASPSPSAPALPGLSSPSDPGPLVETPLPPTGSADGELVDGFPPFLAPSRDSAVSSSSLSAADPVLQVTLSGSTSRSPGLVLGEYRSRLIRKGMREQVAPAAVGGSESVSFARGASTVTISVRREGGTTSYSLFGVLQAREG